MAEETDRDRRQAALAALVSEYEAEHGDISDDEIAVQMQRDRCPDATRS